DDLLIRGIAQADILLSNDGINFTPFITDRPFAMAPGDNITEFAETISFFGATARYVQIAVDANYGSAEFTGLSEVQFFAVPEPSSSLLIAAGPLVASLFARRRRK
ncbi:MAG TPA: PEP-CTERM sorting domain-containing protein, partial [Chthoniobacteraceae bacterium]|nr:PEP-CTERM sorting domain-containing protein [Chthoniobacteraceae bacterium]